MHNDYTLEFHKCLSKYDNKYEIFKTTWKAKNNFLHCLDFDIYENNIMTIKYNSNLKLYDILNGEEIKLAIKNKPIKTNIYILKLDHGERGIYANTNPNDSKKQIYGEIDIENYEHNGLLNIEIEKAPIDFLKIMNKNGDIDEEEMRKIEETSRRCFI